MPRYNAAFRPEALRRSAASPAQSDVVTRPARVSSPADLVAADIEVTPNLGAALARTTVREWPASVPTELRVAREWLARWDAEPPPRPNPARQVLRDYVAALEEAVAPYGEWAWWDHYCNY